MNNTYSNAHIQIVANGEEILYIIIEPGYNSSIDVNDSDIAYFKIYRFRDNVESYSYIQIRGFNFWGFMCCGYSNCCIDDEYKEYIYNEDQIIYENIEETRRWQNYRTEKIEDTDVNCYVIKPNDPYVIGPNFTKLREKVSTLEQKIAELEKKVI